MLDFAIHDALFFSEQFEILTVFVDNVQTHIEKLDLFPDKLRLTVILLIQYVFDDFGSVFTRTDVALFRRLVRHVFPVTGVLLGAARFST